MEPITLGLVAFNVIMGICSNKVDSGVNKIIDIVNPEEVKKRRFNHDLTRAVLIACKESELEILKSFENSSNRNLLDYIRTQIEDVKNEIRNIEKRENHNNELTHDELINMILTPDKETKELSFLYEGREAYPELINRFRNDFYNIAKIKFSYQIKKNNEIANIFISEIVVNIDYTLVELGKTIDKIYTDIHNDLAEVKNITIGIDKKLDLLIASLKEKYNNWTCVDHSREEQKANVNSKKVKDFLCGKKCTWSLAFSDCIVHRNIVDEMISAAKEGGITIWVGAGGEGKSTALMQMCVGLYKEGYTVLYHIDEGDFDLPEDMPANTILVVDNPPDTKQFKLFLNLACQREWTVVMSSRSNEWNMLKETLSITSRDITTEIPISQIKSITEAEKFADCVVQYLDTSRSRDEIVELFMDNSYGFLYAAMLILVYNEDSLEAIADSIVQQLLKKEPQALSLLAYIVFSEHLDITFTKNQYDEVIKELKLSSRKANDALALEVIKNGNVFVTRHSSISNLFYKLLFCEDGLLETEDAKKIRTQIFKYYMAQYSVRYGYEKDKFEKNIWRFLECITSYSDDEQFYMVEVIIEECRNYYPFLVKLQKQIESQELKRHFLKLCFDKNAYDSNLILAIAKSEIKDQNIGNYEDGKYSAREVYRKACLECNSDCSVWYAWAQMEQKLNGIGSYDKKYTTRWIYKEACLNNKPDNGQVWLAWAHMEQEKGDIGSYEEINTAKWIYKEACINHQADSQVWLAWAQMEQENGKISSYEEKNTARWIYKEACTKYQADGQVWLAWAQMEQESRGIGSYEEANTARWIYKEACTKYQVDGQVWLAWAHMEQEFGEIGNYMIEDTAKWIFKEACINHQADGQVWLAWAQMEEQYNNIESEEEPYCARWIYSTVMKKYEDFTSIYGPYAIMELNCNRPDLARKILRQAVNKSNNTLFYLTVLEILYDNIDTNDQYSAVNLMKKMELSQNKSYSVILGLYECSKLIGNNEEVEKYYGLLIKSTEIDFENEGLINYINLCRTAINNSVE